VAQSPTPIFLWAINYCKKDRRHSQNNSLQIKQ
jgi:hypothetical protein